MRISSSTCGPRSIFQVFVRRALGRVERVVAAFAVFAFLSIGSASAQDAPSGASPAAGISSAADDSVDAGAEQKMLNRELRTVEEDVNNLKERVFRSKATLQLLKELVVEGASGGSRITIRHVNEMGNNYSLESIQYFLDGKNVFTKVDPGGQLSAVKEMKIHEQGLPPGTHNLQVKMVLRGNGQGVFSYLRTYQFNVQSSYTFKVEGGQAATIKVTADSRGGLRNFVDRPSLRYEERSDVIREE
ncbi:MAG: dihydrolipoamide acetyltransferase [Myxococcota bacterium]